DVGKEFNPAGIAHECAASVLLKQRAPVADLGHEFLVSYIKGGFLENEFLLLSKNGFVKVAADGQLCLCRREMRFPTDVGHGSPRGNETGRIGAIHRCDSSMRFVFPVRRKKRTGR